jgi:hypothetical protein
MGSIHLKIVNPTHFAMKRAKWQVKPHGDGQDWQRELIPLREGFLCRFLFWAFISMGAIRAG